MRFNVASIILYDSERNLLLQHRSSDAKIMSDYWAFFGGRIDEGETPDDAVRREAQEELNYELRSPKLIVEQDFKEGDAEGRLHVYIEFFKDDRSILKLHEGQDWGWYKESEIDALKMVDRDRQIIKTILNYLKEKD